MFPDSVYEALGQDRVVDGFYARALIIPWGIFIMYALKCGMTNWERVWAASGLASFLFFSERISFCVSAPKTAKPGHISAPTHSPSLHRSHRSPYSGIRVVAALRT